ncbi:MAG: alpha/beta fold hydrolase [Phototrophicaceae bacterium]
MRRLALILIMMLLLVFVATAQEDVPVFETVELDAADDLTLVADYYLPPVMVTDDAPAVILLHMLGGRRGDYDPLIPALLDAGFVVLNVDLRGHGATGGAQDWDLALDDTQLWFDWLGEQEIVSQVGIIGASIGSNVALLACDNDTDCVTTVALSPGIDYRGVMPADALINGLNALLIASHNDRASATAVRSFFSEATGYVSTRLYLGNAHGTRLFANQLESVSDAIVAWLDEQFTVEDA